jgi:hypothetical protein
MAQIACMNECITMLGDNLKGTYLLGDLVEKRAIV